MDKGMLYKTIVISIISMFIGISVQPVFANENIITESKDEKKCDCKETVEKDYIFLKFRCRILYARIYTTWFVGQIMYVYNWRFGWFSIALAIIKNKIDRLQEKYLELGCDQYFPV